MPLMPSLSRRTVIDREALKEKFERSHHSLSQVHYALLAAVTDVFAASLKPRTLLMQAISKPGCCALTATFCASYLPPVRRPHVPFTPRQATDALIGPHWH